MRFLLPVLLLGQQTVSTAPAGTVTKGRIAVDQFEKLQALIKPSPDESRWEAVTWFSSLWEARQKAAAEGKPLLLMVAGGCPIGVS